MFNPNVVISNTNEEREKYLAEKEANIEKARQTLEALEAAKKQAEAEIMSGVYEAFARRNRGGK